MIADLADAVVVLLNERATDLVPTEGFTAVRSYLPRYKLSDMDVLHVTVVPKARALAIAGRNNVQEEPQIDVAVQQRFSAQADVDALMVLVEQIGDLLLGCQIGDYACIAVLNDPIYSLEHMEQHNQFTSVLTCSFRAIS